jgi:hypothetical protein
MARPNQPLPVEDILNREYFSTEASVKSGESAGLATAAQMPNVTCRLAMFKTVFSNAYCARKTRQVLTRHSADGMGTLIHILIIWYASQCP